MSNEVLENQLALVINSLSNLNKVVADLGEKIKDHTCVVETVEPEITPEEPEITPEEPEIEEPEITPEEPEITPEEPEIEEPEITPEEPEIEEPVDTPVNHNLFDLDDVTFGQVYASTGVLSDKEGRAVSGWIPVSEGAYTISSNANRFNAFDDMAMFDADKKFVGRVKTGTAWSNSPRVVDIPAGVAFVRFNMYNTDVAEGERQFVKGGVQLPYQEYRSGGSQEVKPDALPDESVEVVPTDDGKSIYPNPDFKTIHLENLNDIDAAIAEAHELGGANIYLPSGKVEVNLNIKSPNIKLIGTGETWLMAKSRKIVLYISESAQGFEAYGIHVRGQSIAQHEAKSTDVTSLYAIQVWAEDVKLRNFSSGAAAYDSLYLSRRGRLNFEATDFLIDTTARNPLSVISGHGMVFKRGRVRIKKGEIISNLVSTPNTGGLYFIDFEPNFFTDPETGLKVSKDSYSDVLMEDILFENAGGNVNSIIVQDNNMNNDLKMKLLNCTTIYTGDKPETEKAPAIRLASDTKQTLFKNLQIIGGVWNNRTIMADKITKEDGTEHHITLEDSLFKDIVIGDITSFSWQLLLGQGTRIENVTSKDGGKIGQIKLLKDTNVLLKDVSGHTDFGV